LGVDIVQQSKPTADIIAAFTKLIASMRASNPRMKIVVRIISVPLVHYASLIVAQKVAQIIPLGIGNYNTKVQDLNKAIVPWAQGLNKTESPIWIVDQYTGFTSGDLRDGVHPNDKGDEKMTAVWYPAVVRAFEAAKAEKVNVKEVEFIA
jgi:lysophospholipase L1-like esterase